MAKIIDCDGHGDIIFESSLTECTDLRKVLLANPRDVSELDEVKWEKEMRTLGFRHGLKIVE